MANNISFLVIAYNSLETTIQCIESLVNFEQGSEILVLDNGSSEPVFQVVNEKFASKGVLAFRSEENLGVVGGRNYLLDKAKGGIGGKIKENLSDESVGVYGKRGLMFSPDLRSFVVPEKEVDAIAGFFQCFRRNLINEIGILDEKFILYGNEDMDFCLRAKEAGYMIIADDNLPVIHHEHKSSSTIKNLKDFERKNQQYFFEKWKNKTAILEIEKRGLNYLSCLNCSDIWKRKNV